MTKKIEEVFDLLDNYRMLPSYQLERRADIFFAIYLSDIIESKFNQKVNMIIPEFPVRIGNIYPEMPINKSYKLDYLIFTEQNNVFTVELKTDDASTRGEQNIYLQKTISNGYNNILEGIVSIYHATKAKAKYDRLINLLLENGSLYIENGEFKTSNKFIFWDEVVFIKPNKNSDDFGITIDFNEVSQIITSKYDDKMSLRFANSLLEWRTSPDKNVLCKNV